jgi:tetratricopeptide (TPR) repeat protein
MAVQGGPERCYSVRNESPLMLRATSPSCWARHYSWSAPARRQRRSRQISTQFKRFVDELYRAGNYLAALVEAQRFEAAVKARFGTNHANYAAALDNLGLVYEAQGRYAEAEARHKRALAIYEEKLGKDHPLVAGTLNNLVGVYLSQGKYADAEGLYKRSLAIREEKLGRDHPDVAQTLSNLGILYRNQGKYAEAEAHYKRAPGDL